MFAVKVMQIGSSLGVLLTPEVVQHLQIKEGDTIFLHNLAELSLPMANEAASFSVDPATVEQLRAGHEFMRDYHATFRTLAK